MVEESFVSERKEIGKGKQATVYLWNDFAYKVFSDTYPKEWINYEIQIQNQVCKTLLPIVKYYKTDYPNIIKMDYIAGITLGEKMIKEKYKFGIEDLLFLQKQIHLIKNIDIPKLKSSLEAEILNLNCAQKYKEKAINYFSEIEEITTLCHLDFHPLNIMCSNEKYYIIDWINAKLCNPLFDYARTYVILFEFAYRLSQKYLSLLKKDKNINTPQLEMAIYIMALLRTKETDSEKVKKLLEKYN